jgi:hypothetical protein
MTRSEVRFGWIFTGLGCESFVIHRLFKVILTRLSANDSLEPRACLPCLARGSLLWSSKPGCLAR